MGEQLFLVIWCAKRNEIQCRVKSNSQSAGYAPSRSTTSFQSINQSINQLTTHKTTRMAGLAWPQSLSSFIERLRLREDGAGVDGSEASEGVTKRLS
jgi:hypothetical protein